MPAKKSIKLKVKKIRLWLPIAAIITVVLGFGYVGIQQNYRMSANDPQIQLAEDSAAALSAGQAPQSIIPSTKVDITKVLTTFGIIYDTSGRLIVSSANLDGKDPVLPPGVFDAVNKANGERRFTWQPKPGVRIATVVVRYDKGYILAGRSLTEVEKRINQLTLLAGGAWVVAMAISLVFLFV